MKNYVIFHSQIKENQKKNTKKIFKAHYYNFNIDYYSIYKYKRYLVNLNKIFSKDTSRELTNFLDRNVKIDFLNFFVRSYKDYIYDDCSSENMIINYLDVISFKKKGLTFFPYNVFIFIIESMFGGTDIIIDFKNCLYKELTVIEKDVLNQLYVIILKEYSIIWNKVFKNNFIFSYSNVNYNREDVNCDLIDDFFLVFIFRITIVNVSGLFSIACPINIVSKFKEKLNDLNKHVNSLESNKLNKKFLLSIINNYNIELIIKLNNMSLAVVQFLKLKVGDVLSVDFSNNIIAYFNNIPILIGTYKIFKKKHVLFVKEFLTKNE